MDRIVIVIVRYGSIGKIHTLATEGWAGYIISGPNTTIRGIRILKDRSPGGWISVNPAAELWWMWMMPPG